jgi:hypothetical protein
MFDTPIFNPPRESRAADAARPPLTVDQPKRAGAASIRNIAARYNREKYRNTIYPQQIYSVVTLATNA